MAANFLLLQLKNIILDMVNWNMKEVLSVTGTEIKHVRTFFVGRPVGFLYFLTNFQILRSHFLILYECMLYVCYVCKSVIKEGQNIDFTKWKKQLKQTFIEADGTQLKPNKKIRGRTWMKAHIWDGSVNITQNWIY